MNIAFVGVGRMGANMARRLMRGGHQVGGEKGFGAAGEAVYDDVGFGQRRF